MKLTIPLVGFVLFCFVFCQTEAGSRSFQAEGTGCEIGSWQVNEVYRRCEKPHDVGGWRKARWSVRLESPVHGAGGVRSGRLQLQRHWVPGVNGPAGPWGYRVYPAPGVSAVSSDLPEANSWPAPNQGIGISREICILTTVPKCFLGSGMIAETLPWAKMGMKNNDTA